MEFPLIEEPVRTVGGKALSSIPGTSFDIQDSSPPVNLQLAPSPQYPTGVPLDMPATRRQRKRQTESGRSETVEYKSFLVRCFLSNP